MADDAFQDDQSDLDSESSGCDTDVLTREEMIERERISQEILAARKKLQAAKRDYAIRRQLNVLNKALYKLNVRWTLINVTRTINADWFNNAAENTPQQTAMKKALRQGSVADLNVYTVRLNEKTFGYATSPVQYQSNPSDDGVVIRSATVPEDDHEIFLHSFAQ
ncbi:hypothetical protein H0H92_014811, partial [Tricholoma furcatifolium]